ncbi:hypothetical protein R3W88_033667 [Solanum pinnatisectum]|uniref:Uncharacterized protein n=1 Tax=Solanum pinnatisectum TaxID=50273 RepID=A0AAV9K0N0_9SOLN|nr:hypothetical protein R3W88_033667 [Solanum pinnatisectum]
MMHFRDRGSPHPLLEIVGDDQQNPNVKVLLLEVHSPDIGVFSFVKWSKMDIKDVMRNFSSKAIRIKVPLLKSAIHHDVASSKCSNSDGSFNNWSVPSSNFGNDDARRLHHLTMLQGRDLHLTDNGKLSISWNKYIISPLSGNVTLRHDSNFIVESYSAIRFNLMEQPYHGTLLTLVQLWNSSFRLDTFSKVTIPMCLLEGAPLMTREYVDWWPSQRMNTSQGNLCIILKKTKQDSASNEKLHPSSKSQVKLNDTPQVAKTSSKSKTSKDGDVPPKSKLRRFTLASKVTSPASKVSHGSSKTNELHVSSDNDNDKTKAQELDDICCGIDILDTIVIDDNDFVDEDLKSESCELLDLQELHGDDLNNGAVADFTIDLNDLDATAKDFHSSINDIMHTKSFKPSLWPLRPGAPTFEPRNHLRVKSTFVYEMWGALWISELESSIASTLEEIRKVNIIDVSSLENLVENFFKSCEYDTLRSSKMTKESHEKSLSIILDGSMEKLQATLADVEKDLKALTSKKKKVTTLINKYQESFSKSKNVMSNDKSKRLAKLEGAVKKSRQEIISFKLFP